MRTLSLILASGIVANVTLPLEFIDKSISSKGNIYKFNNKIINIDPQDKYVYNEHYVFRGQRYEKHSWQKEVYVDFECNTDDCYPIIYHLSKENIKSLKPRMNYGMILVFISMMIMKIFKFLGIKDKFGIENPKPMTKHEKLKRGIPIHRVRLTDEDYDDDTLYEPKYPQPICFVGKHFTMGNHFYEELFNANPNNFRWNYFNGKWYLMKKKECDVKIDDGAEDWNPNDYRLADYGKLGVFVRPKPIVEKSKKVDMAIQTETVDYFLNPNEFSFVEDLHRGYVYVPKSLVQRMKNWGQYVSSVLHSKVVDFQNINESSVEKFRKTVLKYVDDIYCFYKNSPHFAIDKTSFDMAFDLFEDYVNKNVDSWFCSTKPIEYFYNPDDFIFTQINHQPYISEIEYNKSLDILQEVCYDEIYALINSDYFFNQAVTSDSSIEFLKKMYLIYQTMVDEECNDCLELNVIKLNHYEMYIAISWENSHNSILDHFETYRQIYQKIKTFSGEVKIVHKISYTEALNSFRIGVHENLMKNLDIYLTATDTKQRYDKYFAKVINYLKAKASYYLVGSGFSNTIDGNDFKQTVNCHLNSLYFTIKIKEYYKNNQESEYYLDPDMYKLIEKDGKVTFVSKVPIKVVDIEFKKNDLPTLPFLQELKDNIKMKESEKLIIEMVEKVLESDVESVDTVVVNNPIHPFLKEIKSNKPKIEISIPDITPNGTTPPQLGSHSEFSQFKEGDESPETESPKRQEEDKIIDEYDIIEDVELQKPLIETKSFNLI